MKILDLVSWHVKFTYRKRNKKARQEKGYARGYNGQVA